MSNRDRIQTKTKILNAAEELFAINGFDGTSFRQLTKQARVNLAAINYHFGGKESLYSAMISRRIRPINESRLRRLETLEEQAGGEPVALPLLLDALIRPLFELGKDTANGGQHVAQVVGRSLAEPHPFVGELLSQEYHPLTARFSQAIRRHVPQLAPEEFLWRLSFVIGAMHHSLVTVHRMGELTRGICRNNDFEGALRRLIQSAVAIITAPVHST